MTIDASNKLKKNKKTHFILRIILFFFLVISHTTLFAQERQLSGLVLNEKNKPLLRASVKIYSNSSTPKNTLTDNNGKFIFTISENCQRLIIFVETDDYLPQVFYFSKNDKIICQLQEAIKYFYTNDKYDFANSDAFVVSGKIFNSIDSLTPVDGALIKIINTPFVGVSNNKGEYSISGRFNELMIKVTSPILFQIEKQNYISKLDSFKIINTAELKKIHKNFYTEKLYSIEEINKFIDNKIDSLNYIIKLIDDNYLKLNNLKNINESTNNQIIKLTRDINWLSTKISLIDTSLSDKISLIDKDLCSLLNDIENLNNDLGSQIQISNDLCIELDTIKQYINNIPDTIFYLNKINNTLKECKNYTKKIDFDLRDDLDIIDKDSTKTKRISLKISTFGFNDFVEEDFNPQRWDIKYGIYAYFLQQKAISFSLDYMFYKKYIAFYAGYKFSPFFNKNVYGILNAGCSYYNGGRPNLSLQVPLMIDFKVSDNFITTLSIEYTSTITTVNQNTLRANSFTNISILGTLCWPSKKPTKF